MADRGSKVALGVVREDCLGGIPRSPFGLDDEGRGRQSTVQWSELSVGAG